MKSQNSERLHCRCKRKFEFQNYRIDVQNMINIPFLRLNKINEFPNDREDFGFIITDLEVYSSQIFRTRGFQ